MTKKSEYLQLLQSLEDAGQITPVEAEILAGNKEEADMADALYKQVDAR